MSKQWGHGYQTGKSDANKNTPGLLAAALAAGAAIGALVTWICSKPEKKGKK